MPESALMSKPSRQSRSWKSHRVALRLVRWISCLLSLWLWAGLSQAASLPLNQVPEPLKAWVPWVMHDEPRWQCPHPFDEAQHRTCVWPGVLQLQVDNRGGRFSQVWHAVHEDWVALPGEAKWWPQDVVLDGKAVAVLSREGVPSVRLPVGTHRLEGQWAWPTMPESLALPKQAALLQLSLAGRQVGEPVRDDDNRVWLGRQQSSEGAVEDQAQIRIYRLLEDGIPVRLNTRLHLEVSGQSREIVVPRGLLPEWVPQELQSPLPVILAPDGSLRLQARPGVWDLNLVARHPGRVSSLTLPPQAAPQSDSAGSVGSGVANEEVWVFQAAPALRSVSIEGPPSVDPQQTTLPAEWRHLPAFLMTPQAKLEINEKRRGDVGLSSDQLSLTRRVWLSFDGQAMTFHDRINGRINQATRLELSAPGQLGRADINSQDQLITIGASGLTGLELRRGELNLSADSVSTEVTRAMPAVGWRQDFERVSMQLSLPAGWRLWHAAGVDRADGAWMGRWNLLAFFAVLMISLTVGRLWGWVVGCAAFVMLVLSYYEPSFPLWIWAPLLATAALFRVMPDSLALAKSVMRWGYAASLLVLLLLSAQFAIFQVRSALYPVLEKPHIDLVQQSPQDDATLRAVAVPAPVASPSAEVVPMASSDETPSLTQAAQGQQRPLLSRASSPKISSDVYQQAYRNVDPNAKVQTGPGLPTWSWHTYQLQWDGPVLRDQVLSLWLSPPWVQKLLTVIRLALLGWLLMVLARQVLRRLPASPHGADPMSPVPPATAAASLAVPLLTGLTLMSAALTWSPELQAKTLPPPDVVLNVPAQGASPALWPHQDLLNELKTKLTSDPDCLPQCAELSRLTVFAAGSVLRLSLDIDADRQTAIPVPGGLKYWVPREVRANGQPEALARDEQGRLWLLVSPGHQRVDLIGELPPRDTVQLPLPLKPRQVQVNAPGWSVEGLLDDQVADTFQLTRQSKIEAAAAAKLGTPALPAFLHVERKLYLDLVWRVETTVRRESPMGVPALAQIPLLPGEAVTSANVIVKDNKVLVNLGPNSDALSWTSSLTPSTSLSLAAGVPSDPSQTPWAETWSVNASTLWHLDLIGLAPSASEPSVSDSAWVFYPWPGETLQLNIARPQAVAGQTLTIDRSQLIAKPGARATDYTLTLSLRSSRGLDHNLTLPEGATLQSVQIDGQARPLQLQGRTLTLPVSPGKQNVTISWRLDSEMASLFRTSQAALNLVSVNHNMLVLVPSNRWLLWAQGPGIGPAILFWGVLLVLLLAGWVLSRAGRQFGVPLNTPQWLLLMLGMTQVSPLSCAAVAGWFFLVAWRGSDSAAGSGEQRKDRWRFNLTQLVLIGLTSLMLFVLVNVVTGSLLGQPDMQVVGNRSSAYRLQWTQDRLGSELPAVTLFTLPLMAYRGLMLLWALWLAWSLLGWLRWGWGAWSKGGIWRAGVSAAKASPQTYPPGN